MTVLAAKEKQERKTRMPIPEDSSRNKNRRRRADTLLVFDPTQKVPDSVLSSIIGEWLVPILVEEFLRERGITRESLLTRYRTLE